MAVLALGATTQAQTEAEPDAEAMAKAMAAIAAAGEPGEHHDHTKRIVGQWDAHFKAFTTAGVIEGDGTMRHKILMYGRFIESSFRGKVMEQEFDGYGIQGYDNVEQQHISIWLDSMNTAIRSWTGSCNDDHSVTTMYSEYKDPVSGQMMKAKGVMTIHKVDEYSYEEWEQNADGEYADKTLEIRYKKRPTRQPITTPKNKK